MGYIIEKIYPRRLTGSGVEVIYERIPTELADIRDKAEQLILECTKATKSDTVARYYVETFYWFFRLPRFFLISHLTGGHKSDFWLDRQFTNSRSYVNDNEKEYLDKLQALSEAKRDIDFHFAAQRLMKGWLLVHVPNALALVLLAIWHLIVVNIYALWSIQKNFVTIKVCTSVHDSLTYVAAVRCGLAHVGKVRSSVGNVAVKPSVLQYRKAIVGSAVDPNVEADLVPKDRCQTGGVLTSDLRVYHVHPSGVGAVASPRFRQRSL